MNTSVRKYAIRFIVALFVVFLWSAPHLAGRLCDRNLYYSAAERQDAWWCMLPLLLYALVAVILSLLVDWVGKAWVTRGFHCTFLLLLGGGVLTNCIHQLSKLRTYHSPLLDVANHLGWMLLAAIAGCAFTQPRPHWVRLARSLCLILSPSIVLFALQLATGPVYPRRFDPLPTGLAREESSPAVRTIAESTGLGTHQRPGVYWFIFDEWSYDRTYDNRQLRPQFRRLNEFSRQATVFHNARTPGPVTEISIPSMLYGTRLTPFFDRGQVGFYDKGEAIPAEKLDSIFEKPGTCGYFRALIGFGVAYGKWVGRDLDLCRSRGFVDDARSVSKSLISHASNTAQFSSDPLMKYVHQRWSQSAPFMPYYRQLHEDMRKDVEWVLTQSPRQTFALLHYMLPHKPYLFDENGKERPLRPDMSTESVDVYERHLSALDVRIGEFLDLLRNNGRFDDSLIIITSDHSWRADPLRHTGEHSINHVPFIVKFPGQTEPAIVDTEFQLYRLGELINSCMDGQFGAQQVAQIPAPVLTAHRQ